MSKKPNIVVILADDLGYGDLACYGRRDVQTPHIDRLAAEGLAFGDFHSNGAMCSPTRAALLTGRYQQRAGIDEVVRKDEPGLPRNVVTIADRLGEEGYRTSIFGKWHLGDRIENNPVHYGFDEFRGHTFGDSDYISHVDRRGDLDWWHNLELENDEGYNTVLLTDYAERFIEANRDDPFFLYLSHTAIHFPWMTPDDPPHRRRGTDYTEWHPDMNTDLSKLGPHQNVGPVVRRMIEELDESTGRVIDTLKRLELEHNTLVFFASDNGGYRDYQGVHKGERPSNGPFRGQKTQMYEGGHRVPAIAWWPDLISPGTETDETTMTMDLFPTFLDIADASRTSGDPRLDGVSLLPLLRQDADGLPERSLFWKMGQNFAVRDGRWKLVKNGDRDPELYNLAKDPGEHLNVAEQNAEIVHRMETKRTDWKTDVQSP